MLDAKSHETEESEREVPPSPHQELSQQHRLSIAAKLRLYVDALLLLSSRHGNLLEHHELTKEWEKGGDPARNKGLMKSATLMIFCWCSLMFGDCS